MGSLCGGASGGTSGIMDMVKAQVFKVMVNSGGGSENSSQFSLLKNMFASKFPKAEIV